MIGPIRIPEALYHADDLGTPPSLSSTLARRIIHASPIHAWTESSRLNPDYVPVEKDTFDVGRAAHRAVLSVGADYAVIPEGVLASNGAASTKAAKEWIAEARAAGLTPVKQDVADAVDRMADAVRTRLADMRIAFDPARSELAVAAEIEGTWCRAMIDNAPADPRLPLYDIKTTTDANPEAVIRAVENYGYDMQAAHYLDTWEAVTGERRRFRFVFVEKAPPHEVSVVELHNDPSDDADWMADARSKVREARRIWRECLEADHWPGYARAVAVIGARTWHRQRWADREIGQPITKPTGAALKRAAAWQAPERTT